MASIGSIRGTISVRIGNTALPFEAVEFDVPLAATPGDIIEVDGQETVQLTVDVNRTLFRKQMAKTLIELADRIEGAFVAPGAVVLTCDVCGAQLVNQAPATLKHEADGAHRLDVLPPAAPTE
jgi:hypothetical protein